MKTRTPFSTISYNTPSFLQATCERLVKNKILSFACWIKHNAEEGEKKDHFHVYFEPSKQLQTDDLRDLFNEMDQNNDKPLTIMPCRNSKFEDWYRYAIHDKEYLRKKGEDKKFHYSLDDIHSTEDDYLESLVADLPPVMSQLTDGLSKVANGESSLTDLIANGILNPLQARNAEYAVNAMKYGSTFRQDTPTSNYSNERLYSKMENNNELLNLVKHLSEELKIAKAENANLRSYLNVPQENVLTTIDDLEDL